MVLDPICIVWDGSNGTSSSCEEGRLGEISTLQAFENSDRNGASRCWGVDVELMRTAIVVERDILEMMSRCEQQQSRLLTRLPQSYGIGNRSVWRFGVARHAECTTLRLSHNLSGPHCQGAALPVRPTHLRSVSVAFGEHEFPILLHGGYTIEKPLILQPAKESIGFCDCRREGLVRNLFAPGESAASNQRDGCRDCPVSLHCE